MDEYWKDVVGYESLFKVSNTGEIYSKRSDKVLKQTISKTGYKVLSTVIGGRNGICKCFKVHRFVAEAFLPPPSHELQEIALKTFYKLVLVNHKDCNKLNNHVDNLEWCSYIGNAQHALKNGLLFIPRGAASGSSIFKTEDERKEVYEDFIKSGLSMRKFGKSLNLNHDVISRIVRDHGSK